MRRIAAAFALALALVAVGTFAEAAQCRDDEIEVYRDKRVLKCKKKSTYNACIRAAGEEMRRELAERCGGVYHDCFGEKNLDISLNASACLAGALASCAGALGSCAGICGVLTTAQEWAAYHSCTKAAAPCYEEALLRDRERREGCRK